MKRHPTAQTQSESLQTVSVARAVVVLRVTGPEPTDLALLDWRSVRVSPAKEEGDERDEQQEEEGVELPPEQETDGEASEQADDGSD